MLVTTRDADVCGQRVSNKWMLVGGGGRDVVVCVSVAWVYRGVSVYDCCLFAWLYCAVCV